MKKFFVCVALLFVVGTLQPTTTLADEVHNGIEFRPITPEKPLKRPHAPAYSPIFGEINDNMLTVYSKQVVGGTITVTSSDGEAISYSVPDLSIGFSISLQPGVQYAVTVTLHSGDTYIAYIN